MACPHQDPDWCKSAQLLLTGDVESNPCGTVLYVHIKSPHIKPPSNAIIPPLTGFTLNAHTSNSNSTHPRSYVPHIKFLPQKPHPTYTI